MGAAHHSTAALAKLLQRYPCPQAHTLLPVLSGMLVSKIRDELEAGEGHALQHAYFRDRIGFHFYSVRALFGMSCDVAVPTAEAVFPLGQMNLAGRKAGVLG